jgi:AcrR family transcriptional regulator
MSKTLGQKESASTVEKILNTAAELIYRTGQKEVPILRLAEESGISRATIHNFFKSDDESEKTVMLIYLRIINEFMGTAQTHISMYLQGVEALGPAAMPTDRLIAVFRATLAAFNASPTFGKVVLQQLNLNNKDERKYASEIFGWVDEIIDQAKERGEIAQWALDLDSWKIRQVLFVLTRGLLRSRYLGEGQPSDKSELSEKELAFEVLRILQLYCSDVASAKIQKTIEAQAAG